MRKNVAAFIVLLSLFSPLGNGSIGTSQYPIIDVVRADTAILEESAISDIPFSFNTFLFASNPYVQRYYSTIPLGLSTSDFSKIVSSVDSFYSPPSKTEPNREESPPLPLATSAQIDEKQQSDPLTAKREEIIVRTLELQNLLEEYIQASDKAALETSVENLRPAVTKLKQLSEKINSDSIQTPLKEPGTEEPLEDSIVVYPLSPSTQNKPTNGPGTEEPLEDSSVVYPLSPSTNNNSNQNPGPEKNSTISFDTHPIKDAAVVIARSPHIRTLTQEQPALNTKVSEIIGEPLQLHDELTVETNTNTLANHIDESNNSNVPLIKEAECNNCQSMTVDEEHHRWTVPACSPLGRNPIPNDRLAVEQLFVQCLGGLREEFMKGYNGRFSTIARNMQRLQPLEKRFLAMTLTSFGEFRQLRNKHSDDEKRIQRGKYQNIMRVIENRMEMTNEHNNQQISTLDVVLTKWQFSCYNDNEPNRDALLADHYSSSKKRNSTSGVAMKNSVQAYIEYQNSDRKAPNVKDNNIVFYLSHHPQLIRSYKRNRRNSWPKVVVHSHPQEPSAIDPGHNFYHWNALNVAFRQAGLKGSGSFNCGAPSWAKGEDVKVGTCCEHISKCQYNESYCNL